LFALSRFGKIEFAKVQKSGEIGEGEEENNSLRAHGILHLCFSLGARSQYRTECLNIIVIAYL
jgi:hypothetical protein